MNFTCTVFSDFDGNDSFEVELDSDSIEDAALQALASLGYHLGQVRPVSTKSSEELLEE
jgi:hypothetical protein